MSKYNTKDGWIKNCKENGIILMRLEHSDKCDLYRATKQYEIENCFYYENSYFIVWESDNYVIFRSYIDAYDYYSRRV